MEINPLLWGLSFVWGILLGLFYFGGLWMTLKHVSGVNKPKFWLGVSYVIRIFFIMIGFWIVMKRDLVLFIFTFLAFFITRVILTHTLGRESRGKKHAHQS